MRCKFRDPAIRDFAIFLYLFFDFLYEKFHETSQEVTYLDYLLPEVAVIRK